MKVQGQEHAEWGFKKPLDGWHLVEIGEGHGMLKNKEGELVKNDKGEQLWKFNAKINDDTAEDNEADVSQIVTESAFGERKIADILAAIGEFKKFEEKFPGDRSFFEEAIINRVIIQIQHKFCKMRTETTKDGKYTNVMEIASVKYNPTDSKKEKVAGKTGKEKVAETKTVAGASDAWD
jgi:hypothetical protein